MQRYSNNSATQIKTPIDELTGPSGKCTGNSVHNILTYILIFFLVLLVCYAVVYIYRIYTQPPPQNNKEKFEPTRKRHAIVGLFWDKCGHCKRFAPIFESVTKEYEAKSMFNRDWSVKTIYDTNVAKTTYNVTSFPSVVVLHNDQVVETKTGGMDEFQLRELMRKHTGEFVVQEEH